MSPAHGVRPLPIGVLPVSHRDDSLYVVLGRVLVAEPHERAGEHPA
ncbi:hypothetical protein IW248_001233 [Micromonospora ureilytica]|uniref:Uncharacterized protein n=1 Tax=Micromonospora ureilytica TaxID=709868 RepID=A0ABS0JEL8_9ACTN|nr:hypothetical protein [Micromonospora ureilytica]